MYRISVFCPELTHWVNVGFLSFCPSVLFVESICSEFSLTRGFRISEFRFFDDDNVIYNVKYTGNE